MRRFVKLTLVWAIVATLLPLGFTQAQEQPPEIVVVHTATQEGSDSLGLNVYFSLRDADGNAVLKNALRPQQEGTIQLLGTNGSIASAEIADPQAPIKIVLLLDASGSMRTVIADVQAAAKKALEVAPENAEFAVFKFDRLAADQPLVPLQDFTTNRQLVAQAIDAVVPEPQAPTCLFNAAFQAIETLRRSVVNPQERRAVILFTDGKDEVLGGGRCSQRSVDNVITSAREYSTPIYTIGLCETAACANIERDILQRMAFETAAFPATGERSNLEGLFTLIMDILNSQWVARANVYARQGENQAVVSIKRNDADRLLSGTFSFTSNRDYSAPPTIQVTPVYDREQDRYTLRLAAINTTLVRDVIVEVWDKRGGSLLNTQTYKVEDLAAPVEIQTTGFDVGREYCFRIGATNNQGVAINNNEGSPTLSEQCVTYEPKLDFTITSVDPNWEIGKLFIGVTVRGMGQRRPIFEGKITTKEGQTVANIPGVALNEQGYLEMDLPEQLRRAGERDDFVATLTLQDGEQVLERAREFALTPPRQLPILWLALLGGLLGVTIIATGVVVVRNRRNRSLPIPAPKEFNELTGRVGAGATPPPIRSAAAPSHEPQIRIKIVRTRGNTHPREAKITRFPCLIGRGQTADFVIQGDDGLSRQHVQISRSGKGFEVTALDSGNGTFMNEQRLQTNQPVPLPARTRLRLGPHTILDLETL